LVSPNKKNENLLCNNYYALRFDGGLQFAVGKRAAESNAVRIVSRQPDGHDEGFK